MGIVIVYNSDKNEGDRAHPIKRMTQLRIQQKLVTTY